MTSNDVEPLHALPWKVPFVHGILIIFGVQKSVLFALRSHLAKIFDIYKSSLYSILNIENGIIWQSPKFHSPLKTLADTFTRGIMDMGSESERSSSVLIILTLEILEKAPNDPKLNSNDLTWKVPYRWSFLHRESQIFIRVALRSAFFKILYISWFHIDSHVKITKCHKMFVTWGIAK